MLTDRKVEKSIAMEAVDYNVKSITTGMSSSEALSCLLSTNGCL